MNIPVPYDYPYSLPPESPYTYFSKYAQAALGFLLILLGSWSLVELILGLFHWVTSGQDIEKKAVAKARALKGLGIFILLFVIWVVILFLQSNFGHTVRYDTIYTPQY